MVLLTAMCDFVEWIRYATGAVCFRKFAKNSFPLNWRNSNIISISFFSFSSFFLEK